MKIIIQTDKKGKILGIYDSVEQAIKYNLWGEFYITEIIIDN